jgi:hypothetical protein
MVEQTENNRRVTERGAATDAAAPLILGFVAYSVAAVSTFSIPQLTHAGLDPFAVGLFTSIAGLLVVALGYASIVLLGGICSLDIAGLIARLTKTRQVIRPRRGFLQRLFQGFASSMVDEVSMHLEEQLLRELRLQVRM